MFYLDRHKKQDIIIVLLKAKQDRGQNAQKLIHNFHKNIRTGEYVPRSGQFPPKIWTSSPVPKYPRIQSFFNPFLGYLFSCFTFFLQTGASYS